MTGCILRLTGAELQVLSMALTEAIFSLDRRPDTTTRKWNAQRQALRDAYVALQERIFQLSRPRSLTWTHQRPEGCLCAIYRAETYLIVVDTDFTLWGADFTTPQKPLGTYPTIEEAQQAAEDHHAERKDPP